MGLYGREEAKENSYINTFYTTNSKFSMDIFKFIQSINKLENNLNAFVNLNFMHKEILMQH